MNNNPTKLPLFAALLCWAVWVSIVCVAIFKNSQWVEAVMRLDHTAVLEAYNWNFETQPVLFASLSAVCGLGMFFFRGQWIRFCVVALVALGSSGFLKILQWYVSEYEHGRLLVRTVTIESPKIKDPIDILHISDLEAAEIDAHAAKALEKIALIDADMIIFTGDLIELQPGDDPEDLWKDLAPLLSRLDPPLGFYGVYGDGDYILFHLPVSSESRLRMLPVQPHNVKYGDTELSLKGLSLFQSRMEDIVEPHLDTWLDALEPEVFSILVGHGPSYVLSAQEYAIDLCLAGHTHGGQVRLPILGPLVANSAIPKHLSRGFNKIGKTQINVSAGLGTDRFQGMPIIRFNCPTEMSLIQLRPL